MTLRAAIIGYGTVSIAHIAALNEIPDVIVSDLYSSHLTDDQAALVSRKYNVTIHNTLEHMLADPNIDLVSICSRPDLHATQAIAAAHAGKHIILEKPIALNWQDCLHVQEAIKTSGVMLSVCFECRYSNQFIESKKIVDTQLGEITHCSVGYCHGIGPDNPQFPWNTKKAMGGSSLLSAGCHALDALLFLMGDAEVKEVMSYSSRIKHPRYSLYEYPPHQVTLLTFCNGSTGVVTSNIACEQTYDFPTYVTGTHGSLKDQFISIGREPWKETSMSLLKSGAVGDHPYFEQFSTFVKRIQTRDFTTAHAEFNSAMQSHRVMFMADLSAKLGKPLRLDKDLESFPGKAAARCKL